MGKVISIGFCRGGAGASALALFSSCILAQKSKVLVIDCSSLGYTSSALVGNEQCRTKYLSKIYFSNLEGEEDKAKTDIMNSGILGAMIDQCPQKHIIELSKNGHALPTNAYLELVPAMLYYSCLGISIRSDSFNTVIESVRDFYDYIILDTPYAGYSEMSLFVVKSSDYIVIPLIAEPSLNEKSERAIELARKAKSYAKNIGGVFRQEYDNDEIDRSVEDEIRKQYGNMIFDTVIPWAPSTLEAIQDFGKLTKYVDNKLISLEYYQFVEELQIKLPR